MQSEDEIVPKTTTRKIKKKKSFNKKQDVSQEMKPPTPTTEAPPSFWKDLSSQYFRKIDPLSDLQPYIDKMHEKIEYPEN